MFEWITNKTTKKNYKHTMKKMQDLFGPNYMSIIKSKPLMVLKLLEEKIPTITTRQSHITRIVGTLKRLKLTEDKNIKQSVINKYYDVMMNLATDIQEERGKNLKTKREKENWISWTDVLKIRDNIAKNLTGKNKFLNYLVISLYTLLPPVRTDYNDIKVIHDIKDADDKEQNYLLYNEEEPKFIFNNFKSRRKTKNGKYIPTIIDIPDELFDIIEEWFDDYNKDKEYLLINYDGNPITKKALRNRIVRIFKNGTKTKEKPEGKKISVNLLRHIFISDNVSDKLNANEKNKIAKQMLHSITQQDYYKKRDDPETEEDK